MITIEIITGKILADMLTSGANNLYNSKELVNELNVFPVPDGDTGTNMSLTVTAAAEYASECEDTSISAVSDALAFAALRGARGNSGVILSQLLRGMARSFKGMNECRAFELAAALQAGTDAAYKAVMKPTEGTILTVSKAAAKGAVSKAMTDTDIAAVLENAVVTGNAALKRTPEMLAALKQAGVVDAGGQGLMFILEGMLAYLTTGEITERRGSAATTSAKPQASVRGEDIKFTYCTEFIIEKKRGGESADDFKAAIADKGDCMLVIDDGKIVKVHIHTDNPGFVLEEAVKVGEMVNIKIDNMKHQHKSILSERTPSKVQVVTKAKVKKSKPDTSLEKEYGFAAVAAGKGFANVLRDLGVDRIIEGGQTMNPSANDILKAAAKINARNIFVFPNNSNIIMAAQQAAQLSDKNIIVIPTKNIPQCISAMIKFNSKRNADFNTKSMLRAIGEVQTGQVTYAVRDTVADNKQIKKGDAIAITGGKIVHTSKSAETAALVLAAKLADEECEFLTVYYGKGVKPKTAEELAAELEKKYPDTEVSVKSGGQPVYNYIISAE